jgi:hypothetical protein
LWDEFTVYWNEYYSEQLSKIKATGIIAGDQITFDYFLTIEFVATNDGLYFFRKNRFEETMLVFRSDSGKLTEIMPTNITAKLDWHKTEGLLIAQADICNSFNLYFDLYQLKDGEK